MQVDKKKILIELYEAWSGESAIRFQALPPSGSNREYYRIESIGKGAIGVYNPDFKENRAFIEFSKEFHRNELPVPEIYKEDIERSIYLVEDLGDTTLYAYLTQIKAQLGFNEELKDIYKKVLEKLVLFQSRGGESINYQYCYPRSSFDKQSMMWDLHYFKYYFLKLAGISFDEQNLENDYQTFTDFLLDADREFFMYRDFQSRNVMLRGGNPFFIDYQGGRKGALQYDLASILYDAKADIPEEIREELLVYYLKQAGKIIHIDEKKFIEHYRGYVLIRIMQALGAYGFRGFYERKEHFLQSIPYAIQNLKHLLKKELPVEIPDLRAALTQLTHSKKLEKIAHMKKELTVQINSFSYKRGIPVDESGHGGGFVFDCRAVHNPGRYEDYRNLTGKDQKVIDFLDKRKDMKEFLKQSQSLVEQAIENYLERGFTNLMVSFGCTGGRHRSVYSAEYLASMLDKEYDLIIELKHREQEFL
ncbi:MAG: RNase adapter RapZ [Bacteroidota bacterium]|nr:RNase adapter RapZ [Bacteroidota bacterium]